MKHTEGTNTANDGDVRIFTAEVVGLHAQDRSPCPLTEDSRHDHHRGRPLNPECAALGGRKGFGVLCECGTLLDSGSTKLAALEDKARHLALHRGDLLVHRIVNDGHGPQVIHEIQTLGR
ncbi:hypothetical protein [Streptomyces marianii]|uniref:Uncharacterized protein n=1 Tax=Streptomyces marianii TaxID=1817406 RepID=A0A5R9DVY2_9ACTN|nr:hypothetical protein [Streptomyces marianii]TLQ39293.1 hypothetical protein FEF34_38525 [Streptomyces marianii]